MISPTLYFSIILALSSFLKEEIISLLETHALPLTLSSLINANFWFVHEVANIFEGFVTNLRTR